MRWESARACPGGGLLRPPSGRNGECKKREGRARGSQGDEVRKREAECPGADLLRPPSGRNGECKKREGRTRGSQGDEVRKREAECPGADLLRPPSGRNGECKKREGRAGGSQGDEVRGREAECPGKRKFYPHLCDHWVVTKKGCAMESAGNAGKGRRACNDTMV